MINQLQFDINTIMNPYFQQQQYPFPQQPMPPAQQPPPPQYQQYPYPQMMQPQPNQLNIEAMYTTLQPYNSKQFLVNTFGNRIDYIRVFLSLSHEDKLMMYMLTEQKKLYGEIKDKSNYQRLLKQIAQKVQQISMMNAKQNQKEDKSKELEHRIDDFVEKTFQKLNAHKEETQNNSLALDKQGEEDEQQWVESVPGSMPASFPELKEHRSSYQSYNKQNLQSTLPPYNMSSLPPYNMNSFDNAPKNQGFGFQQPGLKTTIESEKKSIWDLQLAEEEVKESEPSLRQIFHSHHQENNHQEVNQQEVNQNLDIFAENSHTSSNSNVNSEPENNSTGDANSLLSTNVASETNDFSYQNGGLSLNLIGDSMSNNFPSIVSDNNINPLSFSEHGLPSFNKENAVFEDFYPQSDKLVNNEGLNHESIAHTNHFEPNGFVNSEYNSEFNTIQIPEAMNIPEQIQPQRNALEQDDQDFVSAEVVENVVSPIDEPNTEVPQSDVSPQEQDEEQFNDAEVSEAIPNNIDYSMTPEQNNPPIFSETQPYQRQESENINNYNYPQPTLQENPVAIQNNHFELDLLGGFEATVTTHEDININPAFSSRSQQQNFNFIEEKTHEDYFSKIDSAAQRNVKEEQKNIQNIQYTQSIPSVQQNMMSESALSFSNAQNYSILESVRIQMSQQDRKYVERQLVKRLFQCNPDFYIKIIDYMREISLENTPQFQLLSQQYKTVKELQEETFKYTAAVDEDQEDKVTDSIRRSKNLLQAIGSNTSRIEQFCIQILDDNCQERGYLYKFGKLLVDSRINSDILSRVIQQQNSKIQTSFYVLYMMEKLNVLHKLKNNTELIMQYANQQYDKYRGLDSQMMERLEQEIERYPKYGQFIKGFVKLLEICQRMINLLKICGMKSQVNMVKTLKICKDIKTKYSKYRQPQSESIVSQRYRQILKNGILNNRSLYDIHSTFTSLCEQVPICSVCLCEVGDRGQKIEGEYYCHYACFNLLVELQKEQ